MITKQVIPALLFASTLAVPAHAADSFAGDWSAHMGGESNRALTCSFTLKGKILSGSCNLEQGSGPVPGLASGSVNGKNLKWTLVLQQDGMKETMEYTGQWDLKNSATLLMTVKEFIADGKPLDISARAPQSVAFARAPAK